MQMAFELDSSSHTILVAFVAGRSQGIGADISETNLCHIFDFRVALMRPSRAGECCEGWNSATRETVTPPCVQRRSADQEFRSVQLRDARHRKRMKTIRHIPLLYPLFRRLRSLKGKYSPFSCLSCVSENLSSLYCESPSMFEKFPPLFNVKYHPKLFCAFFCFHL